MALGQLLSTPDQVALGLSAADSQAAIRELAAHLVAAGLLPESRREAVEAAVLAREATMSTGVGNGVAIPHAITPAVPRMLALLGTSREGIDFDASDGQPVHLVVMLVVPDGEFRSHLGNLSKVAKTLSRREIRDSIRAAASVEEVLGILRAADAP